MGDWRSAIGGFRLAIGDEPWTIAGFNESLPLSSRHEGRAFTCRLANLFLDRIASQSGLAAAVRYYWILCS